MVMKQRGKLKANDAVNLTRSDRSYEMKQQLNSPNI